MTQQFRVQLYTQRIENRHSDQCLYMNVAVLFVIIKQ